MTNEEKARAWLEPVVLAWIREGGLQLGEGYVELLTSALAMRLLAAVRAKGETARSLVADLHYSGGPEVPIESCGCEWCQAIETAWSALKQHAADVPEPPR
jgi:hypothetical protein